MGNFTLGLDLGTNSIGWAIIKEVDGNEPSGITACGVRIFQEAVDTKTKTPKNQARRTARGARRLISRRRRRREKLLNLLLSKKLLPENTAEREKIFADNKTFDPYLLRKCGLDEKLAPYEFGRVLYHLSQRRGFLSNRKTASKDDGEVKGAITALRQEMIASKSRTLGEYLAGLDKKRNRYTERAMFKEEFELIWLAQEKHYPDLLNPAFKVAVHNSIFFQRPLNLQKNLVGKCTFEPYRKRAARALLEAQRFRMLQDINHLAVKNPKTRQYRTLASEERAILRGLLEKQKTLSWGKARKALKLHEGEIFNLEEGKTKELTGNRTAYSLRSILENRWDAMKLDEQNELITDMLTIDNGQGFLNRMKSFWGFDPETAEKLAKTELEPGYARLSHKAICKILPYLEKGLIYSDACKDAGYDHSAPNKAISVMNMLAEPPYLRNPVVQKALFETRKVINAIVRQYGKPSVIRIEMARDMKLSKKQKDELNKEQNNQKKKNDRTKEILSAEFGITYPTRDDIQKYNMWLECNEVCPYTGVTISREMLFSPDVDVEHILPYSRTLDDSYMNKTLCIASENRSVKHNKTPHEAYSADEKKYEDMLQRVKALPFPKRKKFEQEEVDTDKFIERQLNDTRYICTEVKNYLQQLGSSVEVSKGGATAVLRHRWNLNKILSDDGTGEKNRADHRHHAVDALVIALTSRRLFQKLSRLSAQSGASLGQRGFSLELPWVGFFSEACEKVDAIVVSHASNRKISDALHEDTAYGYDEHSGHFVYSKPLNSLTLNEVEKIRDRAVRELALARLAEFGNDLKKAFGDENNPLMHVNGKTPIRSARLMVKLNMVTVHGIKDATGKDYKFFKYGNNHHVEIVENLATSKREGRFVTTLEAAKRTRRDKTAIVRRDHGPEWKFVMSLCINDMLEVVNANGVIEYYRVQKLSGPIKSIILRHHVVTASSDSDNAGILRCSPNTLPAESKKVAIDSLGNITPCHD